MLKLEIGRYTAVIQICIQGLDELYCAVFLRTVQSGFCIQWISKVQYVLQLLNTQKITFVIASFLLDHPPELKSPC